MNNIILIGMMGCGKSTLAIKLAAALNCFYLDTDDEIETEENKSISEMFSCFGEEYFRKLEKAILNRIPLSNYVIATGGGIIIDEKNRKTLKAKGYVIYLKALPKTLEKRLEKDIKNRPLLNILSLKDNIEKLYKKRKDWYEQTAHWVIDVDNLTETEVFLLISENLNKLGYNL